MWYAACLNYYLDMQKGKWRSSGKSELEARMAESREAFDEITDLAVARRSLKIISPQQG